MNSENCFLLLGRTGVGKSTLTKILSENESIEIGNSLNSQTQETNCYNCQIDNFNYCLIDTPGYDDSNGRDEKNYGDIKKFLTSNDHKIKGIVLLFSFQDPRFGDSHRKGLQKIVSLIPLKNFWEYITIIFTRTFSGDEDELQKEKEEKLKNFNKTFDVLISAFHKSKNIDEVPFDSIKKVFVDLKIKKTKKNELNNITSIFQENAKLEPLFHKVEITENWKKVFFLKDKDSETGELINVKYKTYNYYNLKGEIIKNLSKPIQNELIKKLTKKKYVSQFSDKFIIIISEINNYFPIFAILGVPLVCSYSLIKGYSPNLTLSLFLSPLKSYKGIDEKKIIEELEIDENF